MPLLVTATPIGNPQDFTTRALDALKNADLVIGEELKILRQILKMAGVQAKAMDQLNEHSDAKDIEHFVNEAREKNVVLVSDCGTPGFCDPGSELVAACHRQKIKVQALPGASSLMALLSICGVRLDQFLFYGFLPAKVEARQSALRDLIHEKRPIVVMETPYRATKLVQELELHFSDRFCILGLNLTQSDERLVRALGRDLKAFGPFEDVEPVSLILPIGFKI